MHLTFFYDDQTTYLKDFANYVFRKTKRLGFTIGALGIIFSILAYRTGDYLLAGSFFTAGIILYSVSFFTVPFFVRDLTRQGEKLTGGETKVMIRLLDNAAEIHQGKFHVSIDYRHLIGIGETNMLYIFQIGKYNGFFIPKTAVKSDQQALDEIRDRLAKKINASKKH